MAEDDKGYDELVSRQPKRRLTAEDIQRTRYGSELDRERHVFWRTIGRYIKWGSVAGALAAAAAQVFKTFHG